MDIVPPLSEFAHNSLPIFDLYVKKCTDLNLRKPVLYRAWITYVIRKLQMRPEVDFVDQAMRTHKIGHSRLIAWFTDAAADRLMKYIEDPFAIHARLLKAKTRRTLLLLWS